MYGCKDGEPALAGDMVKDSRGGDNRDENMVVVVVGPVRADSILDEVVLAPAPEVEIMEAILDDMTDVDVDRIDGEVKIPELLNEPAPIELVEVEVEKLECVMEGKDKYAGVVIGEDALELPVCVSVEPVDNNEVTPEVETPDREPAESGETGLLAVKVVVVFV